MTVIVVGFTVVKINRVVLQRSISVIAGLPTKSAGEDGSKAALSDVCRMFYGSSRYATDGPQMSTPSRARCGPLNDSIVVM